MTHRMRFGIFLAPFHKPGISPTLALEQEWVAERIVQLDHLTRGRVMLGVGPGLAARAGRDPQPGGGGGHPAVSRRGGGPHALR